ncbi:SLOG family protein [Runella slithyformis]|uniref:YspA cpYpsA-related SLOG domain-containing protein n=1 Tax=Runella slithyformis (strain ATCC 29530 / DSM 19594 / LMG 11500 / NCIMB 11436 / LSU 4) TaxID=761193 RepID=A0A7U3ZN35_RUNSL|nr:SLOG family protein [Runella slithyformis]AEI50251.1 hypothetical protein Runsl_3895 [Runella slithyformis DSM 19594]
MRTAIIGTRTANTKHYTQLCKMCDVLATLGGITEVISGGASGADALAERYAKENGLKITVIPADWKTHGKAAGPMRNTEIIEACDQVVALWDGKSTGTADTIRKAKQAGKQVYILRYDETPKVGEQMTLF